MKKKIIIITISVLTLLVISSSLAYYFMFEAPKKEIAERCAGYVPDWENFIECHGVITITDGWLSDYISLNDHIHDYDVAGIDNLDQYIYTDEKMFVINRHLRESSSSDGTRTKYYLDFFQNGEVVENYYDSISDIPTYLVIDYKTGEIKAYQGIDGVPQKYKQYFSKLEK